MDAITLNIQSVLSKVEKTATAAPASKPPDTGNSLPAGGNPAPVDLPDPPRIDIEQVVRQIEDFLSSSQRELQFRVDEGSGRTVISVFSGSGELIRQIPSEELLEVAATLQEQGFNLIDQQA